MTSPLSPHEHPRRRGRRRGRAPAGGGEEPRHVWRARTTVGDAPGSPARVRAALAAHHVEIAAVQAHPPARGAVDEFLPRAPADCSAEALTRAPGGAGERETYVERADAHDLVDAPTRVLALATRTALDPAGLPSALRELLGRCAVGSLPGGPGAADRPDALHGTRMLLRDPSGGTVVVRRAHLPFTPAEFARAGALLKLIARLGGGVPRSGGRTAAPEHGAVTVRRAGPGDLAAAEALHARCSAATLALRYHGPVADVDRYLPHLLSPRFGHSLAAVTASGRPAGLGHLLWDGTQSEVALLVEDAWQRRGVGTALLRGLVEIAAGAGCGSVYAVTPPAATGMIAAMRGLGLPLEYQGEGGTLVLTAALTAGDGPQAAALPWISGRR